MKPDCKEIEQQLSESRREFLAADATINNLELKLAKMAEQLANAESKCAALAAELSQSKSVVSECREYFIAGIMNRIRPTNEGYLHMRCDTLGDETPSHDAFLAEVRAQGVDMARNAMIDFVDGEVGPNKNVPGLIRGAGICVSIAEQLRKGGNQ